MEMQWQPPPPAPLPPPLPPYDVRGATRSRWMPAAIMGSAIVIAAGLVAGALILRDDDGGGPGRTSTCQAWAQTRLALRAVPPLPEGWTWETPNIDTLVSFQNGPVGFALDGFEPQIAAQPPDVAQAARDYVAARRTQMQSLADRTYRAADGVAVDTALARLNQLCGITDNSQPA